MIVRFINLSLWVSLWESFFLIWGCLWKITLNKRSKKQWDFFFGFESTQLVRQVQQERAQVFFLSFFGLEDPSQSLD